LLKKSCDISLLIIQLLFANCSDKSSTPKQNGESSERISADHLRDTEDTTLINKEKFIFAENCQACHPILKTDNFLAGIVERVGINYLKLYLTKQDSLIKAKDKYAIELKKAYGNTGNIHNFHFSDDQLNAIVAYLRMYSP